ncbi:hypothetical protein L2E82_36200 [Cichorium intybus]|uniref:Uncharacterized protein n=1 Tax=Cichorium intybus TaxID=13427 RepID=A0ACB9BQZ4_CICIN|nr:hypothetical protein L2E82_36200 [Cichorium intybus]
MVMRKTKSKESPSFIFNKLYFFDPLVEFDEALNAHFLDFIVFFIYQVPRSESSCSQNRIPNNVSDNDRRDVKRFR